MIFEQQFKIGIREIGMKNEISNYGVLSFLQDIATMHSDTAHYGVKDVFTRKQAWLLMDWQLEVKNRPPFNEDVFVKTYAVSMGKPSFHCYRNFELYNKNNELFATATSKWVLYDFNTNRIVRIDNEIMDLFKTESDSYNSEGKLTKLKELSSYTNIFYYEINKFDIDVNKHVNNLNYLKIAYEALPDDVFFGDEPNNVRIMYKKEIKLGDRVKCLYCFNENKHCLAIKSEDEVTLHAIIELW